MNTLHADHAQTPPDAASLLATISRKWDEDIVPRLVEYIRVPAKSPQFEPDWARLGYLDAVVTAAEGWVRGQGIAGLSIEVVRIAGRSPVLYFDIAPTGGAPADRSVLFYGHLDKQPEMTGWRSGYGPWNPLYEDGRLYGRGAADDGYALYAAIAAITALDAAGTRRPRCIGLIETCEESGSFDLPAYLDALAPRMGNVQLVIALDSGAGNYSQLWATTSLRGLVDGTLRVGVLDEGVHSGDASGIVPSAFRIARSLLDRLEDVRTGVVVAPAFSAAIPAERVAQAGQAARILGESVWDHFPWTTPRSGAVQPAADDLVELVLNRTWRAALAIVAADGLPPVAGAGNVQLPFAALQVSLRLPPTVDGEAALQALTQLLESDPPYGAAVSFEQGSGVTGWNAPAFSPWLATALDEASRALFGEPTAYMGEGGSIPFIGMLSAKWPQAEILVTGVLGPKSNAHGPNEFLHVPYAKKLTTAIALVLAAAP